MIVKIKKGSYGYIEENTIGAALFCHEVIPPKTRIINYVGKIISYTEYNALVLLGKGGYAIHLNSYSVLDCFETRRRWGCWTSLVNDAKKAYDMRNGKRAKKIAG